MHNAVGASDHDHHIRSNREKGLIEVRKDLAYSNQYTRIRKDVARRLFREGKTIYLTPSNVVASDSSLWIKPYPINNEAGWDFDDIVNNYEYYNCCWELGYYTNFWINEDDIKYNREGW